MIASVMFSTVDIKYTATQLSISMHIVLLHNHTRTSNLEVRNIILRSIRIEKHFLQNASNQWDHFESPTPSKHSHIGAVGYVVEYEHIVWKVGLKTSPREHRLVVDASDVIFDEFACTINAVRGWEWHALVRICYSTNMQHYLRRCEPCLAVPTAPAGSHKRDWTLSNLCCRLRQTETTCI